MRAGYTTIVLGSIVGTVLGVSALVGPPLPSRIADALDLETGPGIDRRRAEAVAVLTSRCMRERGFAFTAHIEDPPPIPDADLDPIAWATRWGFGVSTSVEAPAPPPEPDPNQAAATRLLPERRAAYDLALLGGDGRDGCRDRAADSVWRLRDRLLAPIRGDLEALDRAVDADPALTEATAGWAECVIASGVPTPIPARAGLGDRLVASFAARLAQLHGRDALEDLQRDERTLATAVARCDAALVATRDAIAERHERPYVRDHRDRLRALGLAIRAAEAAFPTLRPVRSRHP